MRQKAKPQKKVPLFGVGCVSCLEANLTTHLLGWARVSRM